ncbi:hypothetical protein [Krasilnikovia sp. M28-CT-15]|uniref:hypothetical protein n=1 Tax=Krasilnikovia sp. M28-CT-15 TaxID=3373540 RepID=UPI003876571E
MLNTRLDVIRPAVLIGLQDFLGFYTWYTWTFGWMLRIVFQVFFFALMGRYLDRPDLVPFLVIGGAAATAVLESMTIVLFTSFDRAAGTLPLYASVPGDYYTVVVARNLFNCVVSGTVTASVALVVSSIVLDVSLPLRMVFTPLLLALGALSCYLFGVFLSAIVAKFLSSRWVVLNVAYMGITSLGGFLIPVGFWPAPVSALAQLLPFTHALSAIRGLHGGAPVQHQLGQAGLEVLVLLFWLVVSRVAFNTSINMARRDGSIDFRGA